MSIIRSINILPELEGGRYNKIHVKAIDDQLGESGSSNTLSYMLGEFEFELDESGTYYICTGVGKVEVSSISIPSTHTGDDNVKRYVKEIGAYAFSNLTSLTSVTLPDGIISIGAGAFYNCTSLTTIVIPKNVEKIGNYAFDGSGLESVKFDADAELTEIGVYAFRKTPLTEINLPHKLQVIENGAFQNCSRLNCELVIPESVLEIHGAAFSFSGITKLDMSNSTVTTIKMSTFANCTSLKEVVIGESVKLIEKKAFSGCTLLNACNFAVDYGWFYTSEEISDPDSTMSWGNHLPIEVIAPLHLSQTLSSYILYRLDQMPAPTISIDDGVLTITDPSGIADYFNIYINGKDPITISTKPIIEAGTWVAKDDFTLPTFQLSANIAFTSWGDEDATTRYDILTANNYLITYGTLGSGVSFGVYYDDAGWPHNECKSLAVLVNTEVGIEFFNWFVANFTKQES